MSASKEASALAARSTSAWSSSGANMSACASAKRASGRQPEEREHERERKRQARLRQTPEQREREKEREARRDRAKLKPFLAIDGEGGGTDELGRQNYFLMVASGQTSGEEYILHRQGKPLSTRDCLEFILSLPADRKLVGYGVGYDATQILRGIKPPTLRQILNPRQGKNGPCYTYWGDYAIIYQQGQYLRVARVDRSGPKPAIVKGSCRTVNETLGFFQCSFVKAITDWKIGTDEERSVIAENKTRRDEFSQLTDEIIKYCKLECRYACGWPSLTASSRLGGREHDARPLVLILRTRRFRRHGPPPGLHAQMSRERSDRNQCAARSAPSRRAQHAHDPSFLHRQMEPSAGDARRRRADREPILGPDQGGDGKELCKRRFAAPAACRPRSPAPRRPRGVGGGSAPNIAAIVCRALSGARRWPPASHPTVIRPSTRSTTSKARPLNTRESEGVQFDPCNLRSRGCARSRRSLDLSPQARTAVGQSLRRGRSRSPMSIDVA